MNSVADDLQSRIVLLEAKVLHLEAKVLHLESSLTITTTKRKTTIPVPWTGEIKTEYCLAIVENHGLFTQCNKKKSNKTYETRDNWYCTRCSNNLVEDKPKLGNVVDRQLAPIMEYPSNKKRKCVRYSDVLKKLNISVEDAKEECRKQGVEVSDDLFL